MDYCNLHPCKNTDGEVEKILFLQLTLQNKRTSLEYEGQIRALNIASMKADFLVSGKIFDFNENFQYALDFSSNELKQKSIFDFFTEDNQQLIEEIWNAVVNGIPHEGQLQMVSKAGLEKWFQTTLVAKNNIYGDVDRIIFIANDITNQKELEIRIQNQNKKLLAQEERLKNSEVELSIRLEKAKKDLQQQFLEIEKVKIKNELTLEGALDSILMFNQKGVVEFFNNSAENLWNIDKKLVIGRNVRGLFSDETIKNNDFVAAMVDPKRKSRLDSELKLQLQLKLAKTSKSYAY